MKIFQHWFMKDAYVISMLEEKQRYSHDPYWHRYLRGNKEDA